MSSTAIRQASSTKKAVAPPKKKSGAFAAKGKAKSSGSSGGGALEAGSESKLEAMRKTLYGSDASARKTQDLARKAALDKVMPDPEVHETIMLAWELHCKRQYKEQQDALDNRFKTMVRAIDELEKTDIGLWKAATQGPKFSTVRGTKGDEGKRASMAGRIEGLFPRQLPVLR